MRKRLCVYLKTRRKDDLVAIAVLWLVLIQLVVGSIRIYAQSNYRPGMFSRYDGAFASGPDVPKLSVETALALNEANASKVREDIGTLRSQIAALSAASIALDKRLTALENVNEITSKILNLSYGMVISICAGLVISIVNMRLQKNRRNEQVSKQELQDALAHFWEHRKGPNHEAD